jgi:hypothetical protein
LSINYALEDITATPHIVIGSQGRRLKSGVELTGRRIGHLEADSWLLLKKGSDFSTGARNDGLVKRIFAQCSLLIQGTENDFQIYPEIDWVKRQRFSHCGI